MDNKLENGRTYKEELAAIEVRVLEKGKVKYINQRLKNSLEEILNPNSIEVTPKYILNVSLTSNESSAFINSSGASGRSVVSLNARYDLKDIESQDILASNAASAADNNNISDNRFANYISQEVMEMNLVEIISQDIRNLLINDLEGINRNVVLDSNDDK